MRGIWVHELNNRKLWSLFSPQVLLGRLVRKRKENSAGRLAEVFMVILTNTQCAGYHIGIATTLLKNGKLVRGLDALFTGLELYTPTKARRQEKFEVEILLMECVSELCRLPQIRPLLTRHGIQRNHTAYIPGEEAKLQTFLRTIRETVDQEHQKQP